jgi:hypothetical protein
MGDCTCLLQDEYWLWQVQYCWTQQLYRAAPRPSNQPFSCAPPPQSVPPLHHADQRWHEYDEKLRQTWQYSSVLPFTKNGIECKSVTACKACSTAQHSMQHSTACTAKQSRAKESKVKQGKARHEAEARHQAETRHEAEHVFANRCMVGLASNHCCTFLPDCTCGLT